MTPYHRMEEWYRTHPSVRPFGLYVEMHLQAGVVLSTPDYFVLARPVNSRAPAWRINESMQLWPRAEQDCWYIFAFCGDIPQALAAIPYELPLLCFNRRTEKDLHFLSLPRLRSHCNGQHMAE